MHLLSNKNHKIGLERFSSDKQYSANSRDYHKKSEHSWSSLYFLGFAIICRNSVFITECFDCEVLVLDASR